MASPIASGDGPRLMTVGSQAAQYSQGGISDSRKRYNCLTIRTIRELEVTDAQRLSLVLLVVASLGLLGSVLVILVGTGLRLIMLLPISGLLLCLSLERS